MQMAAHPQPGNRLASNPRTGGGGGFFRAAWRRSTWLAAAYLLFSFPIGLAFFCVFVTLIATGVGTAVTLVGLPILAAAMYGWCFAADADRSLTNQLLGTRVPPMPFDREAGLSPLSPRRAWLRLGNPYTWRSLAHVFLRFPYGLVGFVLLSVFLLAPAWAVSLPFYYAAAEPEFGPGYTVDTLGEALLFTAAAPVVFFLGVHVLRGYARLGALLTSALLGGMAPGETWERPGGGQPLDVVTWRGLTMTDTLDPQAARFQRAQLTAFRWHAAVSIALMLMLLFVNIVTSPGTAWAQWPAWGLAIPLAVHGGYVLRGWFGAHLGLYAVINAGLIGIDVAYGEGTWFFWPLTGWGLALLLKTASTRITGPRGEGPPRGAREDTALSLAEPLPPPATGPAIAVDVEMRRVTVDGREVELTPKEFELLVLLYENPGRPFNRGELLDRIWKNEYEVTERTVDATVVRLRRKLGGRSDAIQTVWGVGYKYQAGV